jgi:hypothetical protein
MQPKLNYCPVCRAELQPTEKVSYATQSAFCWRCDVWLRCERNIDGTLCILCSADAAGLPWMVQ